MTAPTRIALFEDPAAATAAVEKLLDAGVDRERISLVCAECSPESDGDVAQVEPGDDRAVPAMLAGGSLGTLFGGLTGAVTVAVAGGGALVVAGPLLGAAAAGGVAGSLIGAMASRGVEPDVADYYDQAVREGRILVAVDPVEDVSQPDPRAVEKILTDAGGTTRRLPTA